MNHLPDLVHDLSLILIAAGVITVLFKFLKQPIIFGYIIAGFLIGPSFPYFFSITDANSVKTWAEIGVIFLLFSLGLEFSIKKLMNVGGSATVTAFTELPIMFGLGFFTGQLLGWGNVNSFFLAGIVSISSTSVIMKSFEELRIRGRKFVSSVYGILVVEDLVAILLLVILTTFAVTKTVEGAELIYAGMKMFFFLILWLVSGIFLIPTFVNYMRKVLDEETLLVVSLGLCLLMVVLASNAGFSAAFGAFLMGSILSETRESERIIQLTKPVRDLFGAVFFVSVGMLININVLIEHWPAVLVITLVVTLGKMLSNTIGALIAGQRLRDSLQIGISMAQIGEFSFIIATLGLTLKVTDEFLYPVTVAVAAITSLLTPYIIKNSDKVIKFTEQRLPLNLRKNLERYSAVAYGVSSQNTWRDLLKHLSLTVIANSVIVIAIFLVASSTLPEFLNRYVSDRLLLRLLSLTAAIVASAPFLWALGIHRPRAEKFQQFYNDPRAQGPMRVLGLLRIGFALLLITILLTRFISVGATLIFSSVTVVVIVLMFSKYLRWLYGWFEGHFIENLADNTKQTATNYSVPMLAPWDAHIEQFLISPESEMIGRSLQDIKVREKFGVTIVMIERGKNKITAPDQYQCIFPHDRVFVIGTDEQIEAFKCAAEAMHMDKESWPANYALERYLISEKSPFLGQTIRHSGIRENTHGLVVGIERLGTRILNPDSMLALEVGDILWIVGDPNRIRKLT